MLADLIATARGSIPRRGAWLTPSSGQLRRFSERVRADH